MTLIQKWLEVFVKLQFIVTWTHAPVSVQKALQ